MKFSAIAILLASMAAGVFADLHHSAVCITKSGKNNVYEEAITNTACTYYRNRHTGSKWWDTCPDCRMVTSGDIPWCQSDAKHIGGDEFHYYCRLAGASDSLAN
ncbi:MAG: hypothetical protein M1834_009552 [Cirrosporium novae-zelandiae]|nr:MAG: hypothetical protein M1834_009552 [Cirrosporium novae-zelandiae]